MKTKITSLLTVAVIALAGISLTPLAANATNGSICTQDTCCCTSFNGDR